MAKDKIYTWKNIPEKLWREARKKAIDKGKPMKKVLEDLLKEWIKKK